jgi:uncharacterized protein
MQTVRLRLAVGAAACMVTVLALASPAELRTGESPPAGEPVVAPPGVRAKLIGEQGPNRTYQLVLAPGTEAMEAISSFVLGNHLHAVHFEGIGACTDAVLAFYDPSTHAYRKTSYRQQMEIVSIIGDAAPTPGDGAGLHVHMGVAFANGTMHGGHLFETHVSPTMELKLTASPVAVHRAYDDAFKAWLLEP